MQTSGKSHAMRKRASSWSASDTGGILRTDVTGRRCISPAFDDGGRIFRPDADGDTILHLAIILGKQHFALLLIECAPSVRWLSLQNRRFQSPLHLAVLTEQLVIVGGLLRAGADVTSRDRNGDTIMHVACRRGDVDMVSTILNHCPRRCVDTDAECDDVHSALCSLSLAEACESLPKRPKETYMYTDRVSVFNIPNFEGFTCLHVAVHNDRSEVIELLINAGANVDVREGKTGRTSLHVACLNNNVQLVRLLLCHADVNARAYDGLTPFDLARSRDNDDVISVLSAHGARVGTDLED